MDTTAVYCFRTSICCSCIEEAIIEPFASIDRIRAESNFDDADISLLRALTETYSNEPELWDLLGDLMQVSKSYYPIEASMDCYRLAIACDRTYAPAYESLGWALELYTEHLDEAAQNFRLALEFGAGDCCRIGLAQVLAQMGKNEESYDQLKLCKNPTNPDAIQLHQEIENGNWENWLQVHS